MALSGSTGGRLTADKLYRDAIREHAKRLHNNYASDFELMLTESAAYSALGKRLTLIAAHHSCSSKEFVSGLKQIFSIEKPGLVLVEVPRDLGKASIMSTARGDSRLWNELPWSASLAQTSAADIEGLDMQASEVLAVFNKHFGKDGFKLGIYWYFVNYFSSIGKFGNLTLADIYSLSKSNVIQQFLFPSGQLSSYSREFHTLWKKCKAASLSNALDMILQDITDRYAEKKPILELIGKEGLERPYPAGTKYRINKINARIGSYRDLFMINTILESLAKYDNVIAVVGGWHVVTTKAALKEQISAKYGKCIMRKLALRSAYS